MGQSLKKNALCRIAEDLGGNPPTVGPAGRAQASVAPACPQTPYAVIRFQHLTRQLVGIDDIISEFQKAGGRRGLAAADTARESDDHALPYGPDPQRANLKRGWAKTVGQGRRQPRGWPRAG